MSDSLRPHGLQHTRLSCLTLSSGVCSNSCPFCQWCHLNISSSIAPFSFCPQSFPTSGSFPVSQLFTSGGQSIGASGLASILPVNIQGWFSLGSTVLILQSKGVSTVESPLHHNSFLSTTILSLWFNSHICAWLLEKL